MRRLVFWLSLVLMIILALSGCSEPAAPPAPTPTPTMTSTPTPENTPTPVLTEMFYEGLNMQVPFITGVYRLEVGPLDVRKYSEIRLYTFGNSGSGTIQVTVESTDAEGENHGVLDNITLNFASISYATGVYGTPGEYIKVYIQALNPVYVSLAVYGRTAKNAGFKK